VRLASELRLMPSAYASSFCFAKGYAELLAMTFLELAVEFSPEHVVVVVASTVSIATSRSCCGSELGFFAIHFKVGVTNSDSGVFGQLIAIRR